MNEGLERNRHVVSSAAQRFEPLTSADGRRPIASIGPGAIERVLVINLDRQPARWDRICDHLGAVDLASGRSLRDVVERIPAIDGLATPLDRFPAEIASAYTLADFYAVDPQPALEHLENRSGIVIPTSPQELAVAASHLRIWRRVAAGGENALVLEDDAELCAEFGGWIDRAWNDLAQVAPNGFDILYLSYRPVESGMRAEVRSPLLLQPTAGLWWLSGYVLSPRGARRLLAALPIVGPVDQWVNHQLPRLEAFATRQQLIRQCEHGESDNRYSIIPILRTARGARLPQRVTGHNPADSDLVPHARSARRSPVFGIGLSKTGTTSLHEALSALGYRSCHWQSDEFSGHLSALIDAGEELPFEAFTDVASVVERFRDLDRLYPDAAFILTTRDLDDWLRSRARHVSLNRAEVASGVAQHSWTSIDFDAWKSERIRHHESVLRHFKSQPDKLLIFDICGGDGWEPLCKFLRCAVPSQPFPRVDPLSVRDGQVSLQRAVHVVRSATSIELPHDDLPWIDKPEVRPSPPNADTPTVATATAGGSYYLVVDDEMAQLTERWVTLADTFDTNLAMFRPANVTSAADGVTRLEVRAERAADRDFTAGGIATPEDPDRWFQFGRFEAELRPAAADGLLTGLFLYRRDPWQEIDLEFLGRDPTKLLANVYYNPGVSGDLYNYGSRGTPVLVDLGFDASVEFHRYAIEWDPMGIRWLVDDEVVYARSEHPTPVPNLPLRFYTTTWPIDAIELAGRVSPDSLPAVTAVRSMRISTWTPAVSRPS